MRRTSCARSMDRNGEDARDETRSEAGRARVPGGEDARDDGTARERERRKRDSLFTESTTCEGWIW